MKTPKEILIPLGNIVVCDACNGDYTDSPATGGIIYEGMAYCPKCSPEVKPKLSKRKYSECSPDVQFRVFVIKYRGALACIQIKSR